MTKNTKKRLKLLYTTSIMTATPLSVLLLVSASSSNETVFKNAMTDADIKDTIKKQLNLTEQEGSSTFSYTNQKDQATFLEQRLNYYQHQKIYENILFNQRNIDNLDKEDIWNIRNFVLKTLNIYDAKSGKVNITNEAIKNYKYYTDLLQLQKDKLASTSQEQPIYKQTWFDNIKKFNASTASQTLAQLNPKIASLLNSKGAYTDLFKDILQTNENGDFNSIANMMLYFPVIFRAGNKDFYNFDFQAYRQEQRTKFNNWNNDSSEDSKKYKTALMNKFIELYGLNTKLWNGLDLTWWYHTMNWLTFYTSGYNGKKVVISQDAIFNLLGYFWADNIKAMYDTVLKPAYMNYENTIDKLSLNTPNSLVLANAFGIKRIDEVQKHLYNNANAGLRLGILLENAYYNYGMKLKSRGEYADKVIAPLISASSGNSPTLDDYNNEISKQKTFNSNNSQSWTENIAYLQAYQILGDLMFISKTEFDTAYGGTLWTANSYNFIDEDLVNKVFKMRYAGTLLNWKDKTYNINAVYNLLFREKPKFSDEYVEMQSEWNVKYWLDIAKLGQVVNKIELKRIPREIISQAQGHQIIEFSVEKLKNWYEEITSKVNDISNFSSDFKINNLNLTLQEFKNLGLDKSNNFTLTEPEIQSILKTLNIAGNSVNDALFKTKESFNLDEIETSISNLFSGNDNFPPQQALELYVPVFFDAIKSKTLNKLDKEINDKLLSSQSRSIYKKSQQIYKQQLIDNFASLMQMYIVYNSIQSKIANDKQDAIDAENYRRFLVKALTVGIAVGTAGIVATVLTGGALAPGLVPLLGILGKGLAISAGLALGTGILTLYYGGIATAGAGVIQGELLASYAKQFKANLDIEALKKSNSEDAKKLLDNLPALSKEQLTSLNNSTDLYNWYYETLIANGINEDSTYLEHLKELSSKYIDYSADSEKNANNAITELLGVANVAIDLNNISPVFDNSKIILPEVQNLNSFASAVARIANNFGGGNAFQYNDFKNMHLANKSVFNTLVKNNIQMSPSEWNRINKLLELQSNYDDNLLEFNFVKSVYQSTPNILLNKDFNLDINKNGKTINVVYKKGTNLLIYLDAKHSKTSTNREQVVNNTLQEFNTILNTLKEYEANNTPIEQRDYAFGNEKVLSNDYQKLMTLKFLKDLDLEPISILKDNEIDADASFEANVKQILVKYLSILNPNIDKVNFENKTVLQLLNMPVMRIDFIKTALQRVANPEKAMTIVNEGDSLSLNSMLANVLNEKEMGSLEKLVPAKITNKPITQHKGWNWFASAFWGDEDGGDFYKKDYATTNTLLEPIKLATPLSSDTQLSANKKEITGFIDADNDYKQLITKNNSAYQINFNYKKGANNILKINDLPVGTYQKDIYVALTKNTPDGWIITNYHSPRKIKDIAEKQENEILLYTDTISSSIDGENIVGYRNISFNPLIINYTAEDGSVIYFDKLLDKNFIKIEKVNTNKSIEDVFKFVKKEYDLINKHINNLNTLKVEHSTITKFLKQTFPNYTFINNKVLITLPENLSYLNRKSIVLNTNIIKQTGLNYYDDLSYNAETDTYRISLDNKEYTEINTLFDNIIDNSVSLQGLKYNNKPLKLINGKWKEVEYLDALLVEPKSTISYQVASLDIKKPIKMEIYINDLFQNYFSVEDSNVEIDIPLNTRSLIYSMPYVNVDLLLNNFNKDTINELNYSQLQSVKNNEELYFNTFDKLFKYNQTNNIGNAKNYKGFESLYNGIKENSDYILKDDFDRKNGFITEYLYNDKQLQKVIVLPATIQSLNVANGEYNLEYKNTKHNTQILATDFNSTITFNKQGLYELSTIKENHKTSSIYIYVPEQKVSASGDKLNLYNYNLSNVKVDNLSDYKYYKDDILYKKIDRYNNSLKDSQKINVKQEYLIQKLRELNKIQANQNFIYQLFYKNVDTFKKLSNELANITLEDKNNIDKFLNEKNAIMLKNTQLSNIFNFFISNNDNNVNDIKFNTPNLLTTLNNILLKVNDLEIVNLEELNAELAKINQASNFEANNITNADWNAMTYNQYKASVLDNNKELLMSLINYKKQYTQDDYENAKNNFLNTTNLRVYTSMVSGETFDTKFNAFKDRIKEHYKNFKNLSTDISDDNIKVKSSFDEITTSKFIQLQDIITYSYLKTINGIEQIEYVNVPTGNTNRDEIKADIERLISNKELLAVYSTNKIALIKYDDKDYIYDFKINDYIDNTEKLAIYWYNIPAFEVSQETQLKEWIKKYNPQLSDIHIQGQYNYILHHQEINALIDVIEKIKSKLIDERRRLALKVSDLEYNYNIKSIEYNTALNKQNTLKKQLLNITQSLNKSKTTLIEQIARIYGKINYNIFNNSTDKEINNDLSNLKNFNQVIKEIVYQVPLNTYNAMYLSDYINTQTQYNTVRDLVEDLNLHITNISDDLLNANINYKASAFKNTVNIRINNYNLTLNLATAYGTLNITGFSNDKFNDVMEVYIADGWLNNKIHQEIFSVDESDVYENKTIHKNLSAKELTDITGIVVDSKLETSNFDTYDLEFLKDKDNKDTLLITVNSQSNTLNLGDNKASYLVYYDENNQVVGKWTNVLAETNIARHKLIEFNNLNLDKIYTIPTNKGIKQLENYNQLILEEAQISTDLFKKLNIAHTILDTENSKTIIDVNNYEYTFDNVYYSADKIYFNIIVKYKDVSQTFKFVMNNFLDNFEAETLTNTPNQFKTINEVIEFNDYHKYKMVDKKDDKEINKNLIEAVLTNILINNRYIARSIDVNKTPLIDTNEPDLLKQLNKAVVSLINSIFADNKNHYKAVLKNKDFKTMYDSLLALIRFIPTNNELAILDADEETLIRENNSDKRRKLEEYFQINPLYRLVNYNKPLYTAQEISISFIDKVKVANRTFLSLNKADKEVFNSLDKPLSVYNAYDGNRKWLVYDELKDDFSISDKPTYINFLTLKQKPSTLDKLQRVLKEINTYATFSLDYENKKAQAYQEITFDVEIRNSVSKIKYGISSDKLNNTQILETWSNQDTTFIRDLKGVHITTSTPTNLIPLPISDEFGTRKLEDRTTITNLSKDDNLLLELAKSQAQEYDTLRKQNKISATKNDSWKWIMLIAGITILTGGLGWIAYRIKKPKHK